MSRINRKPDPIIRLLLNANKLIWINSESRAMPDLQASLLQIDKHAANRTGQLVTAIKVCRNLDPRKDSDLRNGDVVKMY